jgi:hypothetical protein
MADHDAPLADVARSIVNAQTVLNNGPNLSATNPQGGQQSSTASTSALSGPQVHPPAQAPPQAQQQQTMYTQLSNQVPYSVGPAQQVGGADPNMGSSGPSSWAAAPSSAGASQYQQAHTTVLTVFCTSAISPSEPTHLGRGPGSHRFPVLVIYQWSVVFASESADAARATASPAPADVCAPSQRQCIPTWAAFGGSFDLWTGLFPG